MSPFRTALLSLVLLVCVFVPAALAQTPDDAKVETLIQSLSNLDGQKIDQLITHLGISPAPEFYECMCPAEYGYHYYLGPEGGPCRRIGPLGGVDFGGYVMERMPSCSAAYPLADGRQVIDVIVAAAEPPKPAEPTCSINPDSAEVRRPHGPFDIAQFGAETLYPWFSADRGRSGVGIVLAAARGALSTEAHDRLIKAYLYSTFAEIDYESCGTLSRWYRDYSTQIKGALCLALGAAGGPATYLEAGWIVAKCLANAAKDAALDDDLKDISAFFGGTDAMVRALDGIYILEDWGSVDAMGDAERLKWFEKRGQELVDGGWGPYSKELDLLAPNSKLIALMSSLGRRWNGNGLPSMFTMKTWDDKYGSSWAENSGKGDQITLPAYIMLRLWQLHKTEKGL